jgi:lysophospholipase L1-like esterase
MFIPNHVANRGGSLTLCLAVTFRDIGPAFLDEKGFLSEEMMPDTTHPSEKGHEVWAEAIAPELKKMLSK